GLLTNVAYLGKVRYKSEVHAGEHTGIVDEAVWQRVQERLRHHGRTKGALVRNRYGALLKGLLYCGSCGRCMSPMHASRKGSRRYRYYVCRHGRANCPCPSLPAAEVERFVIEQVRQQATAHTDAAPARRLLEETWGTLVPCEQSRVMRGLVERI